MKARRFRRLRKGLVLQTYTVWESVSLFGDFYGSNRLGLVMDCKKISASSSVRAIMIFMKMYRKDMKRMHEYERGEYSETSERWGHMAVMDEKEFTRFYS